MITTLELTDDFEKYDSKTPYLEAKYRLQIEYDISVERINNMFIIYFIDENGDKKRDIHLNFWHISSLNIEDKHGKAMLSGFVFDSNNISVDEFYSEVFPISSDVKTNIRCVEIKISEVLKKIKLFSYFNDYRARLDYENTFRLKNKGRYDEGLIEY